jgi:hypothetical protein
MMVLVVDVTKGIQAQTAECIVVRQPSPLISYADIIIQCKNSHYLLIDTDSVGDVSFISAYRHLLIAGWRADDRLLDCRAKQDRPAACGHQGQAGEVEESIDI